MLPTSRLLIVSLLLASSSAARIWTDTQGRTIEAEWVKSSATIVTLRRADGQVFALPLIGLSTADRNFVAQKKPAAPSCTAAKISFEEINTLLGLDLLADDNLWDDTPADIAARLKLSLESKTSSGESYRTYPRQPVTVLATPAYMLSLQAAEGCPTAVTIMFANRGDYPAFLGRDPRSFPSKAELKEFDQVLKTDFETLCTALTAKLGAPKSEMSVGGPDPHRRSLRWECGAQAFLASHDADQMVSLKIAPTDRTGARLLSDDQVRKMLRERIAKRPNGDVIIDQIPMVDQGPKGYCVPATFERYLRYVGIPSDMYELAAGGGTDFGGGSSFESMAASLDRYVRRQGRHLDKAPLKFSVSGVARYLDEGRPIVWGLYSTRAFNELSSSLTEARQATTDWTKWKKTVASADIAALGPDRLSAHACLIIGYNRATNEIAFTDSWGPRFAERWVPLAAAQKISQDEFWVISW